MWNAWQLLGAGLFRMILLVHVTFVKHLWGFTLEAWRRIWASLLKRLMLGCNIWQCCNDAIAFQVSLEQECQHLKLPHCTGKHLASVWRCSLIPARRRFPVSHSQLQMRMWTLIRRIFDQLTFIRGPRALLQFVELWKQHLRFKKRALVWETVPVCYWEVCKKYLSWRQLTQWDFSHCI